MTTTRTYKNDRPLLTIKVTGGGMLGRCYHSTVYEVTSRTPLSKAKLEALRAAGFLGLGQEFFIHGQLAPDGSVQDLNNERAATWAPTGNDVVECSEVDDATGEVVRQPSINPYTNKPDVPGLFPYYTYRVESRVDSSD